jgi:hypothetical protein
LSCDLARDAMAGLVADRELHAALGHLVECFDPGRVGGLAFGGSLLFGSV